MQPLWIKTDENTLLNADCIHNFSYEEDDQQLFIEVNDTQPSERIMGVTKAMWHDIIATLAAQRNGRYPNVISIPFIMETRRRSEACKE